MRLIDQILEGDAFNVQSVKHTLKDDLFILTDLLSTYDELLLAFPTSVLDSNDGWMKHLLLSECAHSLGLGATMILRGHLNDSQMYARRAAESMRAAYYIQEVPSAAAMWMNPETRFDFHDSFRNWNGKHENGVQNCDKMKGEIKNAVKMFDRASEASSHASFVNSSLKSLGKVEGRTLTLGIKWHDIDPADPQPIVVSAYNLFFLHSEAVYWWAHRAGLIFNDGAAVSQRILKRQDVADARHARILPALAEYLKKNM